MIRHVLLHPPKSNLDVIDFSISEYRDSQGKLRRANTNLFFRNESNGGRRLLRDWLAFSIKNGNIYCVPCYFFGKSKSALADKNGFRDWKHATTTLSDHEQTTEHFQSIGAFLTRSEAVKGRLDLDFIQQYKTEKEYWIQVLRRIVEVIKHLSSRNVYSILTFYKIAWIVVKTIVDLINVKFPKISLNNIIILSKIIINYQRFIIPRI